MELLNAGAHTDFVNKLGVCPHTGYLSSNYFILFNFILCYWKYLIFVLDLFHLTNNMPRSLKCLSASVLKSRFPKKYYDDQLPQILVKFTNLH